jgi:hypothetical protein
VLRGRADYKPSSHHSRKIPTKYLKHIIFSLYPFMPSIPAKPTDDELAVIDNWRFERRMPSRAAAIRELLKRGLATEGFALADRAVKSKDFGVRGSSA